LLLVYLHAAYISVPKDWTFLDALGWDKGVHLMMFFALTFSWRIHQWWSQRYALWWIIGMLVFAFAMEIMQATMTTYRSGEWWDILADSTGIMLAMLYFKTSWFSRLGLSHHDRK
jgi:hypothetical protein